MGKSLVVSDISVTEAQLTDFIKNAQWIDAVAGSTISFERLDRVSTVNEYEHDTVALIINEAPSHAALKLVCKILKPQGKLLVSSYDAAKIKDSLQLLGLLNITTTDSVVSARKPNSVTAGIILRKKQSMKDVLKSISKSEPSTLVSDADLLEEEDFEKKTNTIVETCGPSSVDTRVPKKKACKNCSCGLKEEEERAIVGGKDASVPDTTAAKSSCGSCYLGDAFRCSGCPYRGLPAFKPGEQVQLSSSMLQDDI